MEEDFAALIREKYKDRRICVAYTSPEMTGFRFGNSMLELGMHNSGMFGLRIMNAVGTATAAGRNLLVENAKAMGITDILWVDADCTFPINGLIRLLKHDKDIVCTTNASRQGDIFAQDVDESGLCPANIAGFPFTLIKMSVFDKLQKPYFAEPPRWALPEINIRDTDLVGEDEYFCHFAKKSGFDVWCDKTLSLQIGHVRSVVAFVQEQLAQPEIVIEPPVPAIVDEVIDAPCDVENSKSGTEILAGVDFSNAETLDSPHLDTAESQPVISDEQHSRAQDGTGE